MFGFLCVTVWCISLISITTQNENANIMKVNSTWPFEQNTDAGSQDKNSTAEDGVIKIANLPMVRNLLEKLNGTQCRRDIATVLQAIDNGEKWAMKMVDASPEIPMGLLQGNLYQLGDFDECVYTQQPIQNGPPIQGKYCLADLDLTLDHPKYTRSILENTNNPLRWHQGKPRYLYNNTIHKAICVPSSCTIEEVKIVFEQLFISTIGHRVSQVRLDQDKCHVAKSQQPFTHLEIGFLCLFLIYMVLVVVATTYHLLTKRQKKDKNTMVKAVMCFSIINSVKFVLNTQNSSSLNCSNGIRFLTMTMILCTHALLFSVGGPMKNTHFYSEIIPRVEVGAGTNSLLYGDSFLVLSAFLMTYLLLRKLDQEQGRVSVFKLCIDRYTRLTPTYLVVVFFYCSFLFRMGQGPLWDSRLSRERDRCLKSWWTHVVYLNNYINTDNICLPQSWQNAADYQLYVVAAFVIYSTWKWPRIGKVVLSIVCLISVLVPIIVTYQNQLDPTLLIYSPEFYDITDNFYFKNFYIKAHMRANSYMVGVLSGYALHKIQTKAIKIPKYVLACGWMLATLFAITSLHSVAIYYSPQHEYNRVEVAVYASLHKVAWCAALGWVMLICVSNNASVVNKFLGWKVFAPLSRLTYCAYLLNGFVELYTLGTMRVAPYISVYGVMVMCASHAFWTYALAAGLTVFVEVPIQSLRNLIFKK